MFGTIEMRVKFMRFLFGCHLWMIWMALMFAKRVHYRNVSKLMQFSRFSWLNLFIESDFGCIVWIEAHFVCTSLLMATFQSVWKRLISVQTGIICIFEISLELKRIDINNMTRSNHLRAKHNKFVCVLSPIHNSIIDS